MPEEQKTITTDPAVDPKKETTDKTELKLDALVAEELKKLGYDAHAKDVIARANAEAKQNRLNAEAAETARKDLADKIAKLEEAEKSRQDAAAKLEADAKAKEQEETNSKKTFEERVGDLSSKFDEKIKELSSASKAEADKYAAELKARDQQILVQAVMAEANKAEIIDDSLVTLFDLKDIPVDHGVPDRDKIAELIAEHKKAKPHLYKAAKEETDDTTTTTVAGKTVTRPKESNKAGAFDWSGLSPQEFANKERELRQRISGIR